MKLTFKAARVNAGLSIKEAVEKLRITRTTLFRWENGTTVPPYRQILKMSELYDCPVDCFNIGGNHD